MPDDFDTELGPERDCDQCGCTTRFGLMAVVWVITDGGAWDWRRICATCLRRMPPEEFDDAQDRHLYWNGGMTDG